MPRSLETWWHGFVDGQLRLEVLLDAGLHTKSLNHKSGLSIIGFYCLSDKGMWDGDPKLLQDRINEEFPGFFIGYPAAEIHLGEIFKYLFRQGRPGHSKPNSQKGSFGPSRFA